MSCRHDLAIGTCRTCYPVTGTIDPERPGESLDGPGASAIPDEELVRLLLLHWSRCRSCFHWGGNRFAVLVLPQDTIGTCLNKDSKLFGLAKGWDGSCEKWRELDFRAAMFVLQCMCTEADPLKELQKMKGRSQ